MPNLKLEGEALLNYLMGRFRMTRKEALAFMREHGQNVEELDSTDTQ